MDSVAGRTSICRSIAVAVGLLLLTVPASASDMAEEFFEKTTVTMIIFAAGFIIGHILCVFVFAKVLGLDGGIFAAILAVLLGGIVGGVVVFIASMVMFFLPPELLQVIAACGGVLGGAVGVKLLFKTDIGHGLLVYLLATTTVYIFLMIALVLAF